MANGPKRASSVCLPIFMVGDEDNYFGLTIKDLCLHRQNRVFDREEGHSLWGVRHSIELVTGSMSVDPHAEET